MSDTAKQKPPRAVIETGQNGYNVELLRTIDKLRHPIRRSRAWVASRLVEDSQIYQEALTVPVASMVQLSLQLCTVRKQKVDKVPRDGGVLKMSELDPMSDIREAHDRMTARVR